MRIAFILALFQGGLTVLGYFLGSTVSGYIEKYDHWIAFLLLMFLGIRMISEGLKANEEKVPLDINAGPCF